MASTLKIGISLLVACFLMFDTSLASINDQVQIQDGHLYKGGKRVRFWGINILGPVMGSPTYKNVDDNITRIKEMGFNAIRWWGTRAYVDTVNGARVYPASSKGDGSLRDLTDYTIYRAKQEGFLFWVPFSNYPHLSRGDVDLVNDPATRDAWLAAINEAKAAPYKTYAPEGLVIYFDPRAKAAFKDHLTHFFNHVNPYTGIAYKDETVFALFEIDNERQFMDKMLGEKGKLGFGPDSVYQALPPFFAQELQTQWNDFLLKKYGSKAGILQAWGSFNGSEDPATKSIRLQPTYGSAANYPAARGADILEFYRTTFVGACEEYKQHIRSLGRPENGCAIVPVIYHTIAGSNHGLHVSYANSFGDAVAYGHYQEMFAYSGRRATQEPFHYPYYSFAEKPPAWDFMAPYRQLNKPHLIYETNTWRSMKFRTDFPLIWAICGSWADLDGIFYYTWDYQFSEDRNKLLNSRLFYATPDHYWHGVTTYSDEIYLSALRTAGNIFKAGVLPPPQNPTIVRFGKSDLNRVQQKWYGALNVNASTHFTNGLRIAFDSSLATTVIEGPSPTSIAPARRWDIGHQMNWDFAHGQIRLDLPSAKAASGFLPTSLTFGDGVELRGINKLIPDPDDRNSIGDSLPYYTFVMTTENGQPLNSGANILVSLVSTSQNTGFRIDPTKVMVGGLDWVQYARAITRGDTPVVVNRVGATLRAPFLKGYKYRKIDFAMNVISEGTVGEEIKILPTEKVFLLSLEGSGTSISGAQSVHTGPQIHIAYPIGKSELRVQVSGINYEDAQLSLFDIRGRIIHQTVVSPNGFATWNLSNKSNGLFFLRLTGKNQKELMRKVMVLK